MHLALLSPTCSLHNVTDNPAAYAAGEYAREMLVRVHTDPSFNATWGLYWRSLPSQVFRAETFTATHLSMLQHPGLANAARAWRQQAENVYTGAFTSTFLNLTYPPLSEELPDLINLEEFLRVVTLVSEGGCRLHASIYVFTTAAAALLSHQPASLQ